MGLFAALILVATTLGPAARAACRRAAPIFGINMSLYDNQDHLLTVPGTRRLFRQWGVPLIRVPLRAILDDSTLLGAMRAVRQVGAAPMLILRGPAGDALPSVLAQDEHLMDLVHSVFGNGTAYLEFGNEPDLAGIAPADYRTAWNTVIRELRKRYPTAAYRFVGPVLSRVDGDHAAYIATFLDGADPVPDALSWHEYVCSAHDDWEGVCVGHLANWAKHVTNVESRVTATIGHELPFFISEWNVDPNYPSPLYDHAARIGGWTAKAITRLENLGPNLAGAMIYTATDHGNFALVTGTDTVTAQGAAFRDASLE